jgi:hypothetical protein
MMAFDASKLLRIGIMATLIALPLIIWLALYLAASWWSVNSQPALGWLIRLRRIGWTFGVALLLMSLARRGILFYGITITTFAAGLSIPESWIKRHSQS